MEPLVVSVEEDDVETSHSTTETSQHQYWSCKEDILLDSKFTTPYGCRSPEQAWSSANAQPPNDYP